MFCCIKDNNLSSVRVLDKNPAQSSSSSMSTLIPPLKGMGPPTRQELQHCEELRQGVLNMVRDVKKERTRKLTLLRSDISMLTKHAKRLLGYVAKDDSEEYFLSYPKLKNIMLEV